VSAARALLRMSAAARAARQSTMFWQMHVGAGGELHHQGLMYL